MPKFFEEAYNDPRVAQLSYQDQQQLFGMLYRDKLATDERYQSLDEANRELLLNKIVMDIQPVFADPSDVEVQKRMELAEGVRGGDEAAQEAGLFRVGAEAFIQQLSLVQVLQKATKGVVEFFNPEATEGFEAYEAIISKTPDQQKASEYLEQSFALTGMAKQAQKRQAIGGMTGMVADFAAWTLATQPAAHAGRMLAAATAPGRALGLNAGKFVGAGKALKSPASRWFWQSAVPEIAFDIRGGAIGIARENILGTVEDALGENPTLFDTVWENSKIFGEYFLGDMIAFGAFQLIGAGAKFGALGAKSIAAKATGADYLGDEAFDVMKKILVTRGGVAPEDIAKLPRRQREILENVALNFERAKRVKDLTPTEKTQLMLHTKGFQLEADDAGKWLLKDSLDESGKTLKFDTFEEGVEKAINLGEERFRYNTPVVDREAANLLGGSTDVRVTEIINAETRGLDLDPNGMRNLLNPKNNKIPPNNLRYVTKEIATKSGVRATDAAAIKFVEVDDYFKKGRTPATDVIEVPKTIASPNQQKTFIKNYLNQLDEIVQSRGGSPNPLADLRRPFVDAVQTRPMSPMYVDDLVKKWTDGGYIRKVGNQMEFIIPGRGLQLRANSVDEIGRYVVREYIAPQRGVDYTNIISAHIRKEFGGAVNVLDNGNIKVTRSTGTGSKRRMTETFSGVDDLLKRRPEYEPKLPVEAMPDINIVTAGGRRFEIDSNTIRGDRRAVLEFMNNFTDGKLAKETVPLKLSEGNVAYFDKVKRKFRVELPELGVQRTFNSLEDAKTWVRGGIKNFDDLAQAARYKGVKVDVHKDGFMIWDAEKRYVAKTLDEAKGIVKGIEAPEWVGKELSGFDPDGVSAFSKEYREFIDDTPAFEESIYEITEKVRKSAEKAGGNVSWKTNALQLVAPTDLTIKGFVAETGNEAIYTLYKGVEDARQAMEGGVASFHRLWKRAVGNLGEQENKRLFKVMSSGVGEGQWAEQYAKLYGQQISERSLRAMTRTRDLLGRSADDGLYNLFGVDAWKFLEDYMPRIRATFDNNGAGLPGSAAESLKMRMGYDKLPPEMQFFFEHTRTDDMLHFAAMDSLSDVMNFYVRKGFQKVHLDKPTKALKNAITNGDITGEPATRLALYLQQVSNTHTTFMDQAIQGATRDLSYKVLKNLEKRGMIQNAEKRVTDDIIGLMNSFTIAATMSYRMWMPIRNLHQPLITIGMRFGLDTVWEAQKRAVKNAEDIIPRLKARGVIPEKAPLMELVSATKLQKFNHAGMKLYQDADAFNRATADQVAEILMQDSGQRLMNGWITEKQFIKMSMLDRVDDIGRKEILTALKEGDFLRAQDIFSKQIITETQFPYKAGTNPLMFEGTWGRLFGGFGHYPVYFVANIARAMKNAPLPQKFATAGRFALTMFAMKKAWEAVGVDARNFNWYQPLQFEGGPYYQFLNTVLKTTNDSYEGARARGSIVSEASRLFVPGSSMFRSVMKGVDSLQQGDTISAVEHFLSMPVGETQF